jgi:hypothetical protein
MAQGRDGGEKDADLAIFHASGTPAILGSDARGVAPAFGETTFVEEQDREGRGLWCAGGQWGRRQQALADQRTQVIAHAVLIPEGT